MARGRRTPVSTDGDRNERRGRGRKCTRAARASRARITRAAMPPPPRVPPMQQAAAVRTETRERTAVRGK
eukprot:3385254-Pleurochrysis_carterae.AAC.1